MLLEVLMKSLNKLGKILLFKTKKTKQRVEMLKFDKLHNNKNQ